MNVKTPQKSFEYLVDKYPSLDRLPVPVEPYISPEFFEREREHLFKRTWLNVARAEELPEAGDYLVKDLAVLRTSVLLLRGKDGVIRAFHNICTHRGTKLVPLEGSGHTRGALSCPFHGWTYNTAGELVGVPAEEHYYDLDKSCNGLRPLGCDIWGGFVFVHPDPAPVQSLVDFLGILGQRLKDYPFAQMQCLASFNAEVKANWKVVADAFEETLHVAYVHRHTMGEAFVGEDNPDGLVLWAELGDLHRTASTYGVPSKSKLFPTEAFAISQFGAFTQGATKGQVLLPGLNPAGVENWNFDLNGVFPNMHLNVGQSQYFTMHFWPLDHRTTRFEFRLYMFPVQTAAQEIARKYTEVVMRDAAVEDLSTVESMQQMLESGALKTIYFSDQELLLRHSMAVIERTIRENEARA